MRNLPKWVEKWPVVLAMTLTSVLTMVGCGGTTTTSNNVTAAPTFSPGGGTYKTTQSVTIASTTPNAVFYCTTDGTTPTQSSPQCAQPTTVFQTEFLQAIAVAPGKAPSTVGSAGYTIGLNSAPIPSFSPAGGTYLSSQTPVTVTISDAVSGADIYYTTDGTVPALPSTSNTSTLYTAPITVSATETLNAIAVASNFNNSGMASATYTFAPVAAAPTFSIAAGTYTTPQQVGLSDSLSGATIYYTLDGTTPTTSSKVYSGVPIPVSSSVTINALAVANGYTNSAVASATYAITLAQAPPPQFSLTLASLSVNDAATDPITIYYTIDGSTPTTSSTPYGGSIAVNEGEVVKAIAAGADYLTSPVSSYTVNFPIASTPTFALSLNQLSIDDVTQGAAIYYTTNGSTPSTASPVYSGPFTVNEGEVINAIAAGTGLVASPAASDTIAFAPTPEPTLSPASSLTSTVSLTISLSDVAGTTIYYTTDGSTPVYPVAGTTTQQYSAPFTVTTTTTVEAIATATAFANSPVASATYTIVPGSSALSGTVVSGTAAVTGAEVQLYAAGQSGYGSSGAALLAQAVTTDSKGDFSFTFNCPGAPGDLLYLVATGGNAGNGTNTNIALMTALGSCNSTSFPANVTVNEVTTIASTYALAPFAALNSGGGIDIGAPGTGASCNAAGGWQPTPNKKETCNYIGLKNAFNTVNNLVNVTGAAQNYTYSPSACVATSGFPSLTALYPYTCTAGAYSDLAGAARSITPGFSSGNYAEFNYNGLEASPYTVSASVTAYASGAAPLQPYQPYYNASTVPQARINALANVLAYCVEDATANDSQCGTLFYNATPTGGAKPVDTLQTALNIALNPGSNGITPSTLLDSMASAYSPSLTAATAPTDLTLALTFTGGGLGIAPGGGYGTDARQVFNASLAIDTTGNLWVGSSYLIGTTASPTLEWAALALFNNQGVPLTTEASVVAGTSVATSRAYGGFRPTQSASATLSGIALDQSGTVWGYQNAGLLPFSLTTCSGSPCLSVGTKVTSAGANGGTTDGIFTIDGSGNLWGADAYGGVATEIAGYDPASGAVVFNGLGGTSYELPLYPYNMVFDSNGGLWASGLEYNQTQNLDTFPVVAWLSTTTPGAVTYNPFATSGYYVNGGSNYDLQSIVADGSGNVYGCISTSSQFTTSPFNQFLNVMSESNGGSESTLSTGTSTGALPNNGRGCGNNLLLDGQGKLFAVTNNWSATAGTTGAAIDEFSIAGSSVQQLSPAAGYSGNNGANEPITLNPSYGIALSASTTAISRGDAAIDPSGNLWVLNPSTGTTASPGNALVEYVGLAAPVVTPKSVALKDSLLAQRP